MTPTFFANAQAFRAWRDSICMQACAAAGTMGLCKRFPYIY